jgi:prolyl-tRNA editing enzyme YbaK/EbsC (Cys-tRNA(Pro) deacylase)
MAGAIDRFLEAARAHGLEPDVRRFPEGTKTAEDAARAIGCDVAQIVKSLVFMADDRPALALTSGRNRVDLDALGRLAGASTVRRATPEEARAATGFAVGGTPPFVMSSRGGAGGGTDVRAFVDETLLAYEELWAAAGTPDAVFQVAPADLARVSGGAIASFAETR